MTSNTDSSKSYGCAIQCMVFNETAWTIATEIEKVVGRKSNVILEMGNMKNLHIGRLPRKIYCKDGWSLN